MDDDVDAFDDGLDLLCWAPPIPSPQSANDRDEDDDDDDDYLAA